MSTERDSRHVPLWLSLAPAMTALAMLSSVVDERDGLFPRWLNVVVFIAALVLTALPFLLRLRRSGRG